MAEVRRHRAHPHHADAGPEEKSRCRAEREDQESGDQQCAGAVDQHEKIALAVFVSQPSEERRTENVHPSDHRQGKRRPLPR